MHVFHNAELVKTDISSITPFEIQIKRNIKIKSTNAKTLPLAKKNKKLIFL